LFLCWLILNDAARLDNRLNVVLGEGELENLLSDGKILQLRVDILNDFRLDLEFKL